VSETDDPAGPDPLAKRCPLVTGGDAVSWPPPPWPAELASAISCIGLEAKSRLDDLLSDGATITVAAAAVVAAVAVTTLATDAAAAVFRPPPSHEASRSGALVSTIHKLSERRPEYTLVNARTAPASS
jgi:hypothetical protein